MKYRVENKYLVSNLEIAVLSQRLKSVMQTDYHQLGNSYDIRSIYFDDIYDSCLSDNENGVNHRRKYRIRCYGASASPIRFEIKEKQYNLTKKIVCPISEQEYFALLEDVYKIPFGSKSPLNTFLLQTRICDMRPRVIISYERTAFVHPSGNVRITFDQNITASTDFDNFLHGNVSSQIPVLPAGLHVLEVKYDEFLPDIIAKQLEIKSLRQTAFSKYYLGRNALMGNLF